MFEAHHTIGSQLAFKNTVVILYPTYSEIEKTLFGTISRIGECASNTYTGNHGIMENAGIAISIPNETILKWTL